MNRISLNPHLPPCKDCEQRELHCHSTCEKWQEYEAKKQKTYADRKERVDEIDFVMSVKRVAISRWYKKKYRDRKDNKNGHS